MSVILLRDRAQIIQAVGAALGLFVAFNVGLDADTAAAVQAVLAALFGVLAALQVRPVAPSVFAGLISAAAILLARFGLEATPEQVAAVQFVAASAVVLVIRQQQTPRADPAPPEVTVDRVG